MITGRVRKIFLFSSQTIREDIKGEEDKVIEIRVNESCDI